jgi:hypothetical protein
MARVLVVQDDIGPVLADKLHSTLAAGGSNHPHPLRSRELHCRDADAAAGTVHQHRFARCRMRTHEERAIRGHVRHTQRRALSI